MRDILRWSAGAVAGLALLCAVVSVSLLAGGGIAGPCPDAPPGWTSCQPYVQQLIITWPQNSQALRFAPWLLALALIIGLPVWITAPLRAERRGGSVRTAILVAALLATALLVVDLFILNSELAQQGAAQACFGDLTGAPFACSTGARATLIELIGLGAGPLAGALLAGLPAWALALAQAARWRRWGWFAAVLLLSPVAALVYAGFGPTGPASSTPARSIAPLAPAT